MERFGPDRLVDRGSRRFQALGLRSAHYGAERWLDILAKEPLLLRMPLVRWQAKLTVGLEEQAWEAWVGEGKP
jgi:arsenate reductase-like glutaredoxin family protein